MKKILIIISGLLVTAGCTKEATIKLPEQEEKLVVTCFISPDEEMTSAVVRTSHPKFSSTAAWKDVEVVENATVVLSGNGQQVTLQFDNILGAYTVSASTFPILSGMTYNLKVTTPDGKSTFASSTVPGDTLRIKSAELAVSDNPDAGSIDISYSAEAEDIPGQINFVALYHHMTIDTNNITNGEYYNYSIGTFEDDEIKPRAGYSLHDYINYQSYGGPSPSGPVPVKLEIRALNCSKDFYLYNRSIQAAAFMGGSPFGDPVMVYTNMNNGFGCFGAYRKTQRSLKN